MRNLLQQYEPSTLFFFHLASVWALVIFSVQMAKDNRFMVSDAFSNSLGRTPLTQTAIAASYTVLFGFTVLCVSTVLKLDRPYLILPVLLSGVAFTTCLACDANAGSAEVSCHNASCALGGGAYLLLFIYVFNRIQNDVPLRESTAGIAYITVAIAIVLCSLGFGITLILSLTLGGDSYAMGICEMLLLFFSVLFVSFSVRFSKRTLR